MTDATLMSALADAPAFADGAHARPALPGAMVLPLGLIRPDPWNRQVSDASVAELEPSIRMHGVLQPKALDKDGKPQEGQTFDDFQLEVTKPKLQPVGSKQTGGPRDAPVRARDPARA